MFLVFGLHSEVKRKHHTTAVDTILSLVVLGDISVDIDNGCTFRAETSRGEALLSQSPIESNGQRRQIGLFRLLLCGDTVV